MRRMNIKPFPVITDNDLKLGIQFIDKDFHRRTIGVFKYIVDAFFKNHKYVFPNLHPYPRA